MRTTEMKLLRDFALAAAAGLAVAAGAAVADAGDKGCSSCGHGKLFGGGSPATTLFGGHKNLPAFQAAPWYNYWPYDAHFLAPAPVSGPFYGPPLTGNFPVNPYFPGPAGAAGFGAAGYGFGYGGVPGGPPPGYPSVPLPPPTAVPTPMPR
jgi:hypothetical protein